jgi:DNA modification methylase
MCESKYTIGNAKNLKNILEKSQLKKPQLIISSPPYFDIKNYGGNSEQLGFGQIDYNKYLDEVARIFQDCYDVSSFDATFWLVIDTFKKDGEIQTLPFDISNRLKNNFSNTWRLKEILIWDKAKGLPWNGNGKFKNEFEYILFFTKSNTFKFNIDSVREIIDLKKWWLLYPERYNPKGKAPSNVWEFTTPIRGWGNGRQNHLCPFPFPLVEKIISIASNENDLVLDPFAGSGTVLAMSKEMNRHSIGIDINENYKEIFEKEVRVGAKKYWKYRKNQLFKNRDAIEKFSTTNRRLRKQKVGSHISLFINQNNSCSHLFILIDSGDDSNHFTLYIVKKSITPKFDLKDEKLQKLLKQSKIIPSIEVVSSEELYSKFKDITLFTYNFEKFYSRIIKIKLSTLLNKADEVKYNYFYSNIEVKIY